MTPPVLFDMDGVILEGPRTAPGIYADAADAALAELGVEPTPGQRRDLRRHDLEHVVEHCETLGIDAADFWQLKDRFASERTHERVRTGERGLYDDVHALEELAAETTLGLVTNNRHATGEFVADYLPVDFAVVRGRQPTFEDYRRRKPDPTFLEDACEHLAVDDALYVGDSLKDVTAGNAAGLETAYLRRPHNLDVERPADATTVVESLTELPAILETLDAR
ncbi:haloacid dehalogenase superfamily, subfamily IA, variant 1 with third motif having Dx(3-4)D or Dx(3-4)E [Natronorubrum sediminis]|uniref:Haloacid dehalogenase superfamily, subfamily IA, variant 1 with third motif having Dx(3-4)D or Dx(3-4)E n=1 Tax=Natronorubrum sediminis TaxID=640943 RepID=A0A1H6FQB6_9EURY|nr:HAD-IA family hydrolase [Natronorubrum sediminis]SEH12542.1 haloacid dehalogenase superfamily, subfamily IA, variant 1 with third motif having Dx(3-4)D or Dx(3-4)E [Natronorubrum sediminis]